MWPELTQTESLIPVEDLTEAIPVEDLPRFGAASNPGLDQWGGLLGTALGEMGGSALSNPAVREALQTAVGQTCQAKAKEGVVAAARENQSTILLWGVGALGVLLIGHFFLSVAALSLAFPRRAFRDIRAALPS